MDIKTKKLTNLKIYLMKKTEEKLKLYLFLHQVLQILKYITQVFRKFINHTHMTHTLETSVIRWFN